MRFFGKDSVEEQVKRAAKKKDYVEWEAKEKQFDSDVSSIVMEVLYKEGLLCRHNWVVVPVAEELIKKYKKTTGRFVDMDIRVCHPNWGHEDKICVKCGKTELSYTLSLEREIEDIEKAIAAKERREKG